MNRKKQNAFEPFFDAFVEWFGGEVLEEASNGYTADYCFHRHNVVAELKCLQEDQTNNMNAKLNRVVEEWVLAHKSNPPGSWKENGRLMMEFSKAPEDIKTKWFKILREPIEDVVLRLIAKSVTQRSDWEFHPQEDYF